MLAALIWTSSTHATRSSFAPCNSKGALRQRAARDRNRMAPLLLPALQLMIQQLHLHRHRVHLNGVVQLVGAPLTLLAMMRVVTVDAHGHGLFLARLLLMTAAAVMAAVKTRMWHHQQPAWPATATSAILTALAASKRMHKQRASNNVRTTLASMPTSTNAISPTFSKPFWMSASCCRA